MAWIQQTTPPPNKILTFSLKNFAGGLNNRSDLIEDNQASNLLNMSFSSNEIMKKRFGIKDAELNIEPLASPIVYLHEYRPYKDEDVLVRATEEKMYIGELEEEISGIPDAVNFKGRYFFLDGEKYRVYGKFPQETTTYEKIIGTAVDEYLVFEIVNPPENFTPLGTQHVKGVVNYDYTNKKVWYEPCQNEINDTHLGSNVLPENPKYIVSHKGRVFVSGSEKDNDNVYISAIDNPFYFAVALPMQLPPNSDEVKGLAVFDDGIVIGRRDDLYVIHGMTNNPNLGAELFKLKRINSHTGFANNHSVDVAHNYLFYLGSDGNVYALGTTKQDEWTLSTTILNQQIDLFKFPIDLNKDDLKDAFSIFFDDEWLLSIKDKVLVYSYRHRAWTMYNHLEIRSFYKLQNQLVFGVESGCVSKFSDDYLDYDTPYEAFWISKVFDMEDSNSQKQFREFFIVAHTFEHFKSDIRMTFEIDYVDVDSEVVIENQISIWGVSRFGDRFITRNINASLPFVIGRRGRGIRFKFSNGFTSSGNVETRLDLNDIANRVYGLTYYVEDEESYYSFIDGRWVKQSVEDLNQAMQIYQVNGDYELRGKR